jgi:hypothetical protein
MSDAKQMSDGNGEQNFYNFMFIELVVSQEFVATCILKFPVLELVSVVRVVATCSC